MTGGAVGLLLRLQWGAGSTGMRVCLGNQVGGSCHQQGNDNGNKQSLYIFHWVSPQKIVLYPFGYLMPV
jgi:hypothetical protein